MTKEAEITNIIRKYGVPIRRYVSKKEPGLYTMVCPGCRKEIRVPGSDLNDVEYSMTKRGSAVVFHTKCYKKAWESKIPQNVGYSS